MIHKPTAKELGMVKQGHPDLQRVWHRYQTILDASCDSRVGEVARTLQKQKENIRNGASKTLKSRHIPEMNKCGVSCAIDLWAMHDLDDDGDLDISWIMKHYKPIADCMKRAAAIENVPIEWGFDLWGWDGPHFQLPWGKYP